MFPAQLNGEISMSKTTACLTRMKASGQNHVLEFIAR